jgi:carboxypeptidase T
MPRIRVAGFALALVCSLAAVAPLTAAPAAATAPATAATPPAADPFAGPGPWMVRAYFGDAAMIREVASWGDHYQLEKKTGAVRILADVERLAKLRALGFYVEVDERGTALLRYAENAAREAAERAARGEAPEAGIPGFPCYRTVEESYASAAAIVAAHPTLATVVDIGDSWDKVTPGGNPGYDLLVLKLTNSAIPGPKPILFIEGAIHAREYTTAETALRFAEQLVNGYGVDPDATWMLDDQEVHVLLQTNPDGRKQAEQGQLWRKNVDNNYCANTSSRGADLNRNFSYMWGCCGGSSGSQCDETYRGPSAASEPEVQTVQNYLLANFPDDRPDTWPGGAAPADKPGLFFDLHSYSQLVLWPWGNTSSPSGNATAFQTLGRKLAYFNGYTPEQSIGLYPTDGTTDDFGYGVLGLASYTIEEGTDFFESCASFTSTTLPVNLQALLYAAHVTRTPYMTPAGPDALSVTATPSVIAPGDPAVITATMNDTRYNNSNGTEPVQNIAAGEVYVDTPPWAGGTPVAMSPADGNFNSSIEGATVTLDSTGFADGRHLLYVRGKDAANNWGAVSAAWLTVIDPASAPIVQGTVTEAGTGTPLAATVTVGPYATSTDPGTGAYSIQVPEGTYDLTASAVGHAPATFPGVTLVAHQTLDQDFALIPYTVVLDDDVENGNIGWTPGGTSTRWAITTTQSHSPTHSWTDSPSGNYYDNSNTWITSPLLDLTGATDTVLSFWHRYYTEATYDFCHVEVSTDGGSTWSEVAVYDGNHTTWEQVTIPVPQLDGHANARVRFRLESDYSLNYDGWYVDDILVEAAVPQAPQAMTVSVVGSGSVASNPPGISCPSDCNETWAYGTPVVLSATPDAGNAFTGWSGDCSGTGTCNLTMDTAHTVTATFAVQDTMPFLDGFESGDTSAWSATIP